MPKRGIKKLPWPHSRLFFDNEVQRVLRKHCLNLDWLEISSIIDAVENIVRGRIDEFRDFKNKSEFAQEQDYQFFRYYDKYPFLMAELLHAMTKARRLRPLTRKDQITIVFDAYGELPKMPRDWDYIPTFEWKQVRDELEKILNQNISVQTLKNTHAALIKERKQIISFWWEKINEVNTFAKCRKWVEKNNPDIFGEDPSI